MAENAKEAAERAKEAEGRAKEAEGRAKEAAESAAEKAARFVPAQTRSFLFCLLKRLLFMLLFYFACCNDKIYELVLLC